MNKKIIAAACGLLIGGLAGAENIVSYLDGDLGYSAAGYTVEVQDGTVETQGLSTGFIDNTYLDKSFKIDGHSSSKKVQFAAPTADGDIKLGNTRLDLLGYTVNNFDFVSTGDDLGHIMAKEITYINNGGIIEIEYNKLSFHLGTGLQYNLDHHLAARAIVRCQKAEKKDAPTFIERSMSFNLGLIYNI